MAESKSKIDPVKTLDEALELEGEVAAYYSYFGDPYSLTNMAYLNAQGAHEIVGLKRQWESVGREPLPDAWKHRYKIWVPWFRQIIDPDDPEGAPKKVLGGFNDVRCIYTYSQTSGEPIEPKPTPDWDIEQVITALGMRRVPFDLQFGGIQGYSIGVELAVSPIAADPLETALHEIGHIACGHTLEHALGAESYHRGIKEYQAEAVAYLVLHLLGVMDDETARHSRGYLRHWLRDEKPPEAAVRQVLTVADRIWRAGRVVPKLGRVALTEPED